MPADECTVNVNTDSFTTHKVQGTHTHTSFVVNFSNIPSNILDGMLALQLTQSANYRLMMDVLATLESDISCTEEK